MPEPVSPTDRALGERVQTMLQWRRVSQAAFGAVLGLHSQSGVSYKLRGIRGWSLDELIVTSRFLGVSLTDLTTGIEPAIVPIDRNAGKPSLFTTAAAAAAGIAAGWSDKGR